MNIDIILDIKRDIVFKKVFLDEKNTKYLKELISKLLYINYNDNLKLANTEIPNSILNKKVSQADIILKNDNNEYIIEMNYTYSKSLYFKNYYYLFKEHTKRSYKENNYGINKKTILINIDNYDLLKEKKLIYEVDLIEKKYSSIMYNNIKCLHINLDYLKNKYYNGNELNELETLLLIFVEQRREKLLNVCKNKYVKEMIEYMDYLQIGDDFITVYDKEKFDKAVKEEFERDKRKLEKEKKDFAKEKQDVAKEKQDVAKEKQDVAKEKQDVAKEKQDVAKEKQDIAKEKINLNNEKIEIARELKILGIPVNKIQKLTKLSLKDITML